MVANVRFNGVVLCGGPEHGIAVYESVPILGGYFEQFPVQALQGLIRLLCVARPTSCNEVVYVFCSTARARMNMVD